MHVQLSAPMRVVGIQRQLREQSSVEAVTLGNVIPPTVVARL